MNIYNLLKNEITQQELLNHYNATITYEKMPYGVNGLVWLYQDIYNIFINDNLSRYMKKKTILHELAHIELHHLGQHDKDLLQFKVDAYEDEADNYVKWLLKQISEQKRDEGLGPNSSHVNE